MALHVSAAHRQNAPCVVPMRAASEAQNLRCDWEYGQGWAQSDRILRVGRSVPERYPCPDGCFVAFFATFWMSCNPNDLVSVTTTGPCTNPDAGLSWYTGAETKWEASVFAARPGLCHIVLTFATASTYSADVTFTEQNQACGCPNYTGPAVPT